MCGCDIVKQLTFYSVLTFYTPKSKDRKRSELLLLLRTHSILTQLLIKWKTFLITTAMLAVVVLWCILCTQIISYITFDFELKIYVGCTHFFIYKQKWFRELISDSFVALIVQSGHNYFRFVSSYCNIQLHFEIL